MDAKDLIEASKAGDIENVVAALQSGADVHAENDGALKGAIYNGHTNCVMTLIEHGASRDVAREIIADKNPLLR